MTMQMEHLPKFSICMGKVSGCIFFRCNFWGRGLRGLNAMLTEFGIRRHVGCQPTPTLPAGRRQNAFHAAALVCSSTSLTGRSGGTGGAWAGAAGTGAGLGVAGKD